MTRKKKPLHQAPCDAAPPASTASPFSYSDTLASLVDSFPIMLASFSAKGRCLFVNKGAGTLFNKLGIAPDDLEAFLCQALEDPETWHGNLKSSVDSRESRSFQLAIKGENPRHILVTFKPHAASTEAASKSLGAIGFDVPHWITADDSALKDRQLALVAHELRNPLSSIQAGLKVLETSPSDERAALARSLMQRQLSHLSSLISDLLEMSRIKAGKLRLTFALIDARDVVDFALQTCGDGIKKPGLTVDTAIPSDTPVFEGDANRLGQAVANLLDNAAKFTPDGGTISVRVSHDDTEIRVSVSDSGIGLTGEQLETLFHPFAQIDAAQQRSHGGLGLGLFIAKSIIEGHHGRIEAHSLGLNQGTTFVVILPRKATT